MNLHSVVRFEHSSRISKEGERIDVCEQVKIEHTSIISGTYGSWDTTSDDNVRFQFNRLSHSDEVMHYILMDLLHGLCRLLTLPCATRARRRMSGMWVREKL